MSKDVKDAGFYRRKYPRRAFTRSLSFLAQGQYAMVTSSEIGEGGLAFISFDEVVVGQDVVLNFRIPGGDFVSLRAEIRSVNLEDRGYVCGVSFKNISFTYKRQIRAYVSSRGATESLIM